MSRRFQFSLKWLFVAMLVVAIAAWGLVLRKRSAEYRDIALSRKLEAKRIREVAKSLDESGMRAKALYYSAEADYRERIALKYERLAGRPWLPVGRDEAPPQEPASN